MLKRMEPAFSDKYELDVIECHCGFHIGLDATYLDQVDEIRITCPSCAHIISTDFHGVPEEVKDVQTSS